MSLYDKGAMTTDRTPSTGGKVVTLNPNAVEFVPFTLRSPPGGTSFAEESSKLVAGNTSLRKTVVGIPESSLSNNSDDEAHQYWHCQLPDDITPDFNDMNKGDTLGITSLPFSNLSFTDVNDTLRSPASASSGLILKKEDELFYDQTDGGSFPEKLGFSVAQYGEEPHSGVYHNLHTNRQMKNGHLFNIATEDTPYNGNPGQGFLVDMLNEKQILERTDINPLKFLTSQFPGFVAESLAEVYFANGSDLNLTIDILTQLELQVVGGQNQNLNSKAVSSLNLSASDFPALSLADGHHGLPKFSGYEIQQNVSPYRASDKEKSLFFKSRPSIPSRGPIDFASVRKMASLESGLWKYDRNGSPDVTVGSSLSSHILASSYNGGQWRLGRNSVRTAPVWVETGDAVAADMYSGTREDAHDHAHLRNAYFEQARQAYLIGNKALAKELSVKGQLHNMHMKAAHAKAQESIYRHRNPLSAEMLGNGRGQERLIDLHGLPVSEAIRVLKRDLRLLRSAARSADQRVQVYICVGTGHHTRVPRTPARLPIAVQRYLLEEEGLDFSEPQPGMLRVVIHRH